VQPVALEVLSVDGIGRLRGPAAGIEPVQDVGPACGVAGLSANPVIRVERHHVDVAVTRVEILQLVTGAGRVTAVDRIPDEFEVRTADAAKAVPDVAESGNEIARPACQRRTAGVTDAPAHPAAVEFPAEPDVGSAESRGYQVLRQGLEVAVGAAV